MSDKRKGRHYCVCCHSNSVTHPELSYFRFPKDELRCLYWKNSLRIPQLDNLTAIQLYNRYRVCSIHFEDNAFAGMVKHKLKYNAVPTLSIEDEEGVVPSTSSTSITHMEGMDVMFQEENVSEEMVQNTSVPSQAYTAIGALEVVEPQAGPSRERQCFAEVQVQTETMQSYVDEKIQTPKSLTKASPTKIKLRSKIRKLSRRYTPPLSPTINLEQVIQFLEESCSPAIANFIRIQVQINRTGKVAKYPEEYKQFALTLYFLSPKAYKFLAKTLRLPSKSTLFRITRSWNVSPGFNNFVFEIIRKKMNDFSNSNKYCTLCLDEMAIKTNLFYNISKDEIIGFHETTKKTYQPAGNVLVLMIRGITSNWKQPLAYFFVGTSTSVEELQTIIFEAITRLRGIGLRVCTVVSDHGSNFFRLTRQLNICPERPYFVCNDERIYYVIDVPHLLKSTRNNFYKYNFEFDGMVTSKIYLEQFFENDKDQKFRLAPKLTGQHINPNNFQKMSVKLAAQVFSATVAAALNAYISFSKLTTAAMPTVTFIEHMDRLFDILNSFKYGNVKNFNKPFTGSEEQIEFLKQMDDLFQHVKILDGDHDRTARMKFNIGWRITINSILGLWSSLKNDVPVLFTRRLNQDCLENYFGKIRQQSGNCRNPTPIQFLRAFKKLFALQLFEQAEGTNCIDDLDDVLVRITPDALKPYQDLMPAAPSKNVLWLDVCDYHKMELPEQNAIQFVCGYLIKKTLQKHTCSVCECYANATMTLTEANVYTYFRSYENKEHSLFGNLKMPHMSFVEYINQLEQKFCEVFPIIGIKDNVGARLKEEYEVFQLHHPCQEFPHAYLRALYIRVRIFYTLKFINKNFKTAEKKNYKIVNLQHL